MIVKSTRREEGGRYRNMRENSDESASEVEAWGNVGRLMKKVGEET